MSSAALSTRGTEGSAPVITAVPGTAPGLGRVRALRTPTHRAFVKPLWIIAACCLVSMAYVGREALVPLGLALLVACILSGTVERLRRLHVPRAVSAAALLLMMAAALVAIGDWVATPAQAWLQNAPRIIRTIDHKVRPAQSILRRVDDIAKRASALANADSAAPADSGPVSAAFLTPLEVFAFTGAAAFKTLTVFAFAFLLLAAGPPALARLSCALAGEAQAMRVLRMIDAVRHQVGRYYATLLLINICFGTVVGTLMWLLGMPNAALWGVLAGTLNFIPYLGPAITVSILTVIAFVTFAGVTQPLMVAGGYVALAAVEGHVVEPVFLGRRLNLNPIVVLLAVWIGGWLWGVAGVLLALPMLLALKVVMRRSLTRRAHALGRL
jgi:predicted PurR-regulated permease PerM